MADKEKLAAIKTSYGVLVSNIIAASGLIFVVAMLGYGAVTIGQKAAITDASYTSMMKEYPAFRRWLEWFFGDMSEATFYKTAPAAIGMLIGAAVAQYAYRCRLRWQGFAISYASGLFIWILLSATLSLLLSNLFWGWTIAVSQSWQPTFVPFVSLPAAIILLYGGSWKNTLSGMLGGTLLVSPIALILVNYLCIPLGLPVVIGNVSAMAIGSIIAFILLRYFPFLIDTTAKDNIQSIPARTEHYGSLWTCRRILADFTESPFFGNELASIGLIIGLYVSVCLNPLSAFYGAGLVVPIIIAQFLSSAIGVVIWRSKWIDRGWYPTYIPVVSVAPACVLAFGGSMIVIIVSAFLGAIIGPPLASAVSSKLPKDFHSYIGNVASMAVTTLIAFLILKALLPLL